MIYGCRDPNPVATGGAAALQAAGVETVELTEAPTRADAVALVARWALARALHRPFVTWKLAATLDGRVAARDGSSKWITGPTARADVHRLRAECDTVLVGTGTAIADDPQLTVRDEYGRLAGRQPTRAVMGLRDLALDARVLDGDAPSMRLSTRDPAAALATLWAAGSRHVLLEGGPSLAASFLAGDHVDQVIAYVAPAVLGAGPNAVGDLGLASIVDALRFELEETTIVGGDVRITMRAHAPGA